MNYKFDKIEGVVQSGSPRLSLFWFLGAIVSLILVDQFTKWFFYRYFPYVRIYTYLGLERFDNYHFAFSLPLTPIVMYGVYISVLSIVAWYLIKHWPSLSRLHVFAWSLILAGACSNILERVSTGYVKDFIHILYAYINVADIYIVAGATLLLLSTKPLVETKE